MGKVKQMLEEDMMNNPDYYNGYIDYDMYEGRLFMISRKEEILERECIKNRNDDNINQNNVRKESIDKRYRNCKHPYFIYGKVCHDCGKVR